MLFQQLIALKNKGVVAMDKIADSFVNLASSILASLAMAP
jgi:hypothetical protein